MHNCRPAEDTCMLGSSDRESSRGIVGSNIHIDT